MTAKLVTVQRHIMEQQEKYPEATGAFTHLLQDLLLAAKIITREVRRAGLQNILGLTGQTNIQGEQVAKLDEFANETIRRAMDHGGHLCCMASEENVDVIPIPERYPKGRYVLLFDPLDGSSNIDANVTIGTIFSVYRRVSKGTDGTVEDCTQPGTKQVAAGYILYGSSTMFVYTTGNGVHGFTLDPTIGEFLLSHENIRCPRKGKIYSVNESNYTHWDDGTRRFIDYLKETNPETDRPYSLRYVGSLVADLHRTLVYGGVFLYPADRRNPRKPKGKLRLMYEANPAAMIMEQAGGRASTGTERILAIVPEELHQRVPLIVGSQDDVELYEKFVSGGKADEGR
ncbi:MAG: class 1 fructose-bisphosphatase [Candidatus Wallbacteria bacterium]|nr:class 1 fructose-bisphosphatase [Candidatus Wallbacteria bacterium]